MKLPICNKLALRHMHPRDACVQFDAATHTYTFRRSESSAARLISRSVSRAADAAARCGLDGGFIVGERDIKRWVANPDAPSHAIAALLSDTFDAAAAAVLLPKLWLRKRDAAAARGRACHRVVELLLNGAARAPPSVVHVVTESLGGSGDDALAFVADELCLAPANRDAEAAVEWASARGLIPVRTEWVVFSIRNDIAGTIDAVFTTAPACGAGNDETRDLVLVDWKFCKPQSFERSLPKYEIQINLYLHILREGYGVTKKRNLHLYVVNVADGVADAREVEVRDAKLMNHILTDSKI